MSQRKKKANRRRPEEEVLGIPNWSELCPDLLRYAFKGLSFPDLNRAKSVCSSWYSASRGCLPTPNKIPWLILFPYKENNSSSCVLFIPDDKDNVYKTRELGVDFVESLCLATYSSWLLMSNTLGELYILNPLTGERIDLPTTIRKLSKLERASFWIDNKTKDYLVVLMMMEFSVFTKKGYNKWQEFLLNDWYYEIVYNHKNQKLYLYYPNLPVKIWDFSEDTPRNEGYLGYFWNGRGHFGNCVDNKLVNCRTQLAVTLSGDVLMVTCCTVKHCKTLRFRIYKANHRKWVEIDSLGDEALILDMSVTVLAKEGIKRNSIYFSGLYHRQDDPKRIFVFDLTTQKIEPLPQCVFSSIQFSDARWFFPEF